MRRVVARDRRRADRHRSLPPWAEALLASWEEYARGTTGSAVQRAPAVAIAVFPNEPERAVYNTTRFSSAILLLPGARWMRSRLRTRPQASRASLPGFTKATPRCAAISNGVATRSTSRRERWAWRSTTSACPRPQIELGPPDWFEYARIIGVRQGLLSGADHAAFHVLVARLGRRERRDCDGVRSRRRLQDLQRHNVGACSASWNRPDRRPHARRARARMSDGRVDSAS